MANNREQPLTEKNRILAKYINRLANLAVKSIEEGIRNRTLQPMVKPCEIEKTDDFLYNENGPSYSGSTRQWVQTPNWDRAAFIVNDTLRQSNCFLEAELYVTKNYSKANSAHLFQQFAFKLYRAIFQFIVNNKRDAITNVKQAFLKELNGDKHRAKTTIYLNGVILEERLVRLGKDAIIRQTAVADIERPKGIFNNNFFQPLPSAIIEITNYVTHEEHYGLHEQAQLFVKALRLFNFGSVDYNSCRFDFETITTTSTEHGSRETSTHPWKKFLVKLSERKSLSEFCKIVFERKDLLDHKNGVNDINIAFDRYSEAVLENIPIERRVANAVMGMEALLSDPAPELKYKLSTRIAKLLSFFKGNPLEVKSFVAQAYDVRSKFAHGGHLTTKDKNKIVSNFGGTDNFASTVLNYLRVLIVIFITIDVKKETLINLIDESLIDAGAASTLKKQLPAFNKINNASKVQIME